MKLTPAGWYYLQAGRILEWRSQWMQRAREARDRGHCDIARMCVGIAREKTPAALLYLRRARKAEAV